MAFFWNKIRHNHKAHTLIHNHTHVHTYSQKTHTQRQMPSQPHPYAQVNKHKYTHTGKHSYTQRRLFKASKWVYLSPPTLSSICDDNTFNFPLNQLWSIYPLFFVTIIVLTIELNTLFLFLDRLVPFDIYFPSPVAHPPSLGKFSPVSSVALHTVSTLTWITPFPCPPVCSHCSLWSVDSCGCRHILFYL